MPWEKENKLFSQKPVEPLEVVTMAELMRGVKSFTKGEKQKMPSYERTICGPCIHKFNNSGLYKATELGPRHKCFCEECGARAYGARCRIETTAGPRPKAEQNRRP